MTKYTVITNLMLKVVLDVKHKSITALDRRNWPSLHDRWTKAVLVLGWGGMTPAVCAVKIPTLDGCTNYLIRLRDQLLMAVMKSKWLVIESL